MVGDIFFKIDERSMILLCKDVKCFFCDVPKRFRTLPADFGHPRPIFNFFVISKKKHFFGGILLASESPYLRVVNFTTILGMFFIYNGKCILKIFNKNQITIKIICTMQNLTESIPPKKHFFERQKKLKIGRGWPMSAGTVADGFWTSLQKHLTPFHKKILVRSSILKNILASDSGWVISGQHGIN